MRLTKIFSIALLFVSWTYFAQGQNIRLNVITFNPCDSTFDNELLIHLVKGDKKFEIADTLGTIYLTEPGAYKLKFFFPGIYRTTDSVKLVTIHAGQNYDTLTRSTIMDGAIVACILPLPKPSWNYQCCDKPCEGYNVDYFDNGRKKVEGTFKMGIPIGQLIFYNPDGTKKEIHHFDKAGKGRLKKKETFP